MNIYELIAEIMEARMAIVRFLQHESVILKNNHPYIRKEIKEEEIYTYQRLRIYE